MFSAFAAALGAADKVVELIQRLPQMPDPGGLKPGSFSGHLELKDVEFSYPSRPDTRVLSGVSLSVRPGEASRHCPWQPFPILSSTQMTAARICTGAAFVICITSSTELHQDVRP